MIDKIMVAYKLFAAAGGTFAGFIYCLPQLISIYKTVSSEIKKAQTNARVKDGLTKLDKAVKEKDGKALNSLHDNP